MGKEQSHRPERRDDILVHMLESEAEFNPKVHVEKILGSVAGGDVTVACWEPGQTSPNHCHPDATEIYFCFEGGGIMNVLNQSVDVIPGAFIVHPPGELHEYVNGPKRSLLFRVRYGKDMAARVKDWSSNPNYIPSSEDLEYYPR
ncbi:MAG: cupin domain-containing protein [Pseudomonadota bacterium]|nr:cupin domain-containing protein [Pseudomonadota bacterium]